MTMISLYKAVTKYIKYPLDVDNQTLLPEWEKRVYLYFIIFIGDLKEEVSSSKVPSISTLMREEVIIDNKAGLLNLQASEAHLNEGAVLENEEVKCNGAGLLNQEGGPIPLVQNPDASESVPLSTNTFKGI